MAKKTPKHASGYPPAYRKFWMDFEVSAAKLAIFRVLFFAVFAIDAWLQVAHAPRYGHLDFNVSHFPFLDGILPLPTRATMVVLYAAQCYLAFRILMGGAHRALYVALALVFAYAYFISQLNSYQHHYLLAIALGLVAAFPWPSTAPSDQRTPDTSRANNWPVRMLLVAISVMYLYAALAKFDSEWTNGSTLQIQLQKGWIRDLAEGLGWAFTAKLALVAELVLALLIHWRRAWPLAFFAGVGMHMSFHWAGLKIGLFSYFMITLYLLILPERWIAWCVAKTRPLAKLHGRARAFLERRLNRPLPIGALVFAASLAAGLALLQLIPLDSLAPLTWAIAGLALAEFGMRWRRPGSAGLAHLVACLLILLVVQQTDSLRDYYRFWGGNNRRAGKHFEAMMAYEKVVQIAPDYAPGHKSLGNLYLRLDRRDDALAQYQAGLRIEPDNFQLNRSAAQILHKLGRGQEALEAAERGLASKPRDASLLAIRKHWQGKLKSHAP